MSKEKQPFAVIRTGGKQFTVKAGDRVRVPSIEADVDSTIEFGDVLLKSDGAEDVVVGGPLVDGASVKAKVIAQDRAAKIIVFKRRRRKGYKKKQGHRQGYTEVQIENIA
ncbi:MAG: 50S ribosomal protein L21 [Bdellovibrionales bacterium]|nr:50S ribosomal protein L21 [Bdellovibrionales bacterium]